MIEMQLPAGWVWGTELAGEMLDAIATLGAQADGMRVGGPKKIEYADFTIYWAGSVLRIDIPEKSLR